MADYFENTSIVIPIQTADERVWWGHVRDVLQKGVEDLDTVETTYLEALALPEEAQDCTICAIDIYDGAVCLTDDGGVLQSDGLAAILQAFLKRFEPDGHIAVEIAFTCSEPCPDGFGGCAMLVTADRVLYQTLGAWIDEAVKSEGLETGKRVNTR